MVVRKSKGQHPQSPTQDELKNLLLSNGGMVPRRSGSTGAGTGLTRSLGMNPPPRPSDRKVTSGNEDAVDDANLLLSRSSDDKGLSRTGAEKMSVLPWSRTSVIIVGNFVRLEKLD